MKKIRLRLAAILAGTLNGLFGGGGGMALLPLLSREPNLQGRVLFANSVAIMLPISMASIAASLFSAEQNSVSCSSAAYHTFKS